MIFKQFYHILRYFPRENNTRLVFIYHFYVVFTNCFYITFVDFSKEHSPLIVFVLFFFFRYVVTSLFRYFVISFLQYTKIDCKLVPKRSQHGAKMLPKWSKKVSKWSQHAPKIDPDGALPPPRGAKSKKERNMSDVWVSFGTKMATKSIKIFCCFWERFWPPFESIFGSMLGQCWLLFGARGVRKRESCFFKI